MQVRRITILAYSTMEHNFVGITYDAIEAAFVGYCYGESTSGQVDFFNHLSSSPWLLTCGRVPFMASA